MTTAIPQLDMCADARAIGAVVPKDVVVAMETTHSACDAWQSGDRNGRLKKEEEAEKLRLGCAFMHFPFAGRRG